MSNVIEQPNAVTSSSSSQDFLPAHSGWSESTTLAIWPDMPNELTARVMKDTAAGVNVIVAADEEDFFRKLNE